MTLIEKQQRDIMNISEIPFDDNFVSGRLAELLALKIMNISSP